MHERALFSVRARYSFFFSSQRHFRPRFTFGTSELVKRGPFDSKLRKSATSLESFERSRDHIKRRECTLRLPAPCCLRACMRSSLSLRVDAYSRWRKRLAAAHRVASASPGCSPSLRRDTAMALFTNHFPSSLITWRICGLICSRAWPSSRLLFYFSTFLFAFRMDVFESLPCFSTSSPRSERGTRSLSLPSLADSLPAATSTRFAARLAVQLPSEYILITFAPWKMVPFVRFSLSTVRVRK